MFIADAFRHSDSGDLDGYRAEIAKLRSRQVPRSGRTPEQLRTLRDNLSVPIQQRLIQPLHDQVKRVGLVDDLLFGAPDGFRWRLGRRGRRLLPLLGLAAFGLGLGDPAGDGGRIRARIQRRPIAASFASHSATGTAGRRT